MYKKLILVLVLVAALLLDAVPVYAAESDDLPFPDPMEYLESNGYDPDEYRYYVVYRTESQSGFMYSFLFSQERFVVKSAPESFEGDFRMLVAPDCSWIESVESWSSSDSKFPFVNFLYYKNDFSVFNTTSFISLSHPDSDYLYLSRGFLYSNYNIWDEENNLVFHTAPMKGHPAVMESILGTVVTPQMMEPTMTEILGLVPSVIGLIIFCLGLRKAYQFLVTHLRQA